MELVSGSEPDSRGICKGVKTRGLRKPVISLAAAAALAACGFSAWLWHQQSQEAAVAVSYEDAAQRKELARQQEMTELENRLAQDSSALLKKFVDVVFERPIRSAGWQVSSYEWNSGIVTAVWTRRHGNISDLATHLSDGEWVFDESTGKIFEQIQLPAPQKERRSAQEWLEEAAARYLFLDILSLTPGTWTLAKPASAGKHYRFSKSELSGSSRNLSGAILAADYIQGQPIHITRIVADLNGWFTWNLEGEFYEHNS